MKILSVIHQFYPEFGTGTEKFLFNVASALQRDGQTVHVVAHTFDERNTHREGDLLIREYSYRGLPVTAARETKLPIDINTSWSGTAINEFAANFLRKYQPDVVHLAHPMRLGGFAQAAERLGIPYIVTLTDFWTICPKITLQTSSETLCAGPKGGDECARSCPELDQSIVRPRLRQSKYVLERARAIVVPSRFLVSLVQAEFPEIKVKVIPHGIPRPRSTRQHNQYRPGDKLVFGYAGGLAPHKGVHILLDAFRKVRGPAELKIYGSHFEQPDYYDFLKKVADGDMRIRFSGAYSDEKLDTIFEQFDVLVIPSIWYETYSLSAHEALARGIPVIASRLGAIEEAVEDGVSGWTVAPGDVSDLSKRLETLLSNPQQLSEIRVRLRTRLAPMVEEEAYLYHRIYRNQSDQFPGTRSGKPESYNVG